METKLLHLRKCKIYKQRNHEMYNGKGPKGPNYPTKEPKSTSCMVHIALKNYFPKNMI